MRSVGRYGYLSLSSPHLLKQLSLSSDCTPCYIDVTHLSSSFVMAYTTCMLIDYCSEHVFSVLPSPKVLS